MSFDNTVDFVVVFVTVGMLVAGLGSLALGWVVKTYDRVRGGAMSSAGEDAPQSPPSSIDRRETDARQTPPPPKMQAEELLTLCRLMRAASIKREDAQAAFTACGLPFNNNVWTRAATPPPAHVTPVAGRPTDAKFETDADYPYQPIKN